MNKVGDIYSDNYYPIYTKVAISLIYNISGTFQAMLFSCNFRILQEFIISLLQHCEFQAITGLANKWTIPQLDYLKFFSVFWLPKVI